MVDIPYHTHQFDIPTASEGEIRTGVEAGKAITPDKLFPVLADKANKATTLAGYGIVDAATKGQGQKADTAVQPAAVSAVGFSGRYDDLLNKPALGGSSGLNVGTTTGTVAAGDDARIVNAVQKATIVSAGAGLIGGGTLAANISLALSSTALASLGLADTAVQPARKISAGTGLTGGGDFSADRTVALNAASIASLGKADTAVQPAAIANFATRAELTAGLATKLDTGAQAADSAKLQGYTALTLPISTAMQSALDGKATTAQGAKADTAVQPSDLGALAKKDKIATTDISATGSTSSGAILTQGGVWVDPSGGGDMFRATYDPTNKAADAFSMGNMAETATAKVMTDAERTKLAGIATGATANTGTVTSIGVAVPTGLITTGAITTSGTITISYATGYQGYTTVEANKLAGIAAGADKTPALAAVATTGSYTDLSNKPTIPAAQVQTDWNAASGISSIANKPATFPPSAHTHSPSEVGLGNVANKTEAQMAASGAIADKFNTQQSAINGKQNNLGYVPINKAGDTFNGDVNIPYLDTRRGAAYTQQSLLGFAWSTGYPAWRMVLNGNESLAWWAYNPNTGDAYGQRMLLHNNGSLAISGSISKASGTWLIDHPLDPSNKNLRHGFTEAPEHLNIYRGVVRLVNGKATVDIDDYFGMMFGTFWAVNTDIMVSALQNQEGKTAVWPESKMTGGIFNITCDDEICNDEIAWMVTGRRKDPYVLYLDPNCERGTGRFIPEFEKEV